VSADDHAVSFDRPEAPGSVRLRVARAALQAALEAPGVLGSDSGPSGLRLTADPPSNPLVGVSATAQADGRYGVDLSLVASMVPLPELAEEVRDRVRKRAGGEQLEDVLGTINVEFAYMVTAEELAAAAAEKQVEEALAAEALAAQALAAEALAAEALAEEALAAEALAEEALAAEALAEEELAAATAIAEEAAEWPAPESGTVQGGIPEAVPTEGRAGPVPAGQQRLGARGTPAGPDAAALAARQAALATEQAALAAQQAALAAEQAALAAIPGVTLPSLEGERATNTMAEDGEERER
jgi:hypothetical protein